VGGFCKLIFVLIIEIDYLIGGNTKGEVTISIYVFLEAEYHI